MGILLELPQTHNGVGFDLWDEPASPSSYRVEKPMDFDPWLVDARMGRSATTGPFLTDEDWRAVDPMRDPHDTRDIGRGAL